MNERKIEGEIAKVEAGLRQLQPQLPGVLRYRFQNTLDHFERSFTLFDIDKEMASFRAITGEEEAATTLMECIHLRKYEFAKEFKRRDHQHKAAVMACVMAISLSLDPLLKEFQLIFDYDKKRIDVKIPLSNFGVENGDQYAIQFIEPLDLVHSVPGLEESRLFEKALQELAEKSKFDSIKRMVSDQANARNILLYASDSRTPKSKATLEGLEHRKNRALAMLVLSVMIWQADRNLALVKHAILAFLRVISKLPIDEAS